jgi:hypothetical protein
MITPSFGLTATERVLPKLALDFTTASLDPRVTFARSGNTATRINASGVIETVNADIPRFDYNPTTLACRGLLIETSRTNILLNSLVDGTSLATQSVTVLATAYTLSFYGTGEVVLSGTASATVTGTGVYPARTTYTFTPTAGSLTLTVTGTVQFAQLEAGIFATSFIPTAGSAVTRNPDIATMTGTNFSDWFNASEGAFAVWFDNIGVEASGFPGLIELSNSANVFNNFMVLFFASSTGAIIASRFGGTSGGAGQWDYQIQNITKDTPVKVTGAYKLDSIAAALDGANLATDNTATMPVGLNQMKIGSDRVNRYMNGHLAKILFYPQRLINNEVVAFSK